MWRRTQPSLNVTFTTFVIPVFAMPTVTYTDFREGTATSPAHWH